MTSSKKKKIKSWAVARGHSSFYGSREDSTRNKTNLSKYVNGFGFFADFWEDLKELAEVWVKVGLPLPGENDFEALLIKYNMESAIKDLRIIGASPVKRILWNLKIVAELFKKMKMEIAEELSKKMEIVEELSKRMKRDWINKDQ